MGEIAHETFEKFPCSAHSFCRLGRAVLVAFPCAIFLDLGSLCPVAQPQEVDIFPVAFAPAWGVQQSSFF